MISTLYIIGNGFDMYHGLNTSYRSFAFFLQDNYPKIHELLIQYYRLPNLDRKHYSSLRDPLWKDFENALAGLDFETVLEDSSNYVEDLVSGEENPNAFSIEMDAIVDTLTVELYKAFREFILSVKFPPSVDDKLIELKGNSFFLNFNYTDTLEKYYGIRNQRMLYIHGKAKAIDMPLILGHAINPQKFNQTEPTPPKGLTEEQLKRWEEQMSDNYSMSFEMGKATLMSYFKDSFKPTKEIIQKHQTFFETLKDIKQVFVLGHSISPVDQPYFKKVIESIPDKNIPWTVTYLSAGDLQNYAISLPSLGLTCKQIKLVKMETLKPIIPTLFP